MLVLKDIAQKWYANQFGVKGFNVGLLILLVVIIVVLAGCFVSAYFGVPFFMMLNEFFTFNFIPLK